MPRGKRTHKEVIQKSIAMSRLGYTLNQICTELTLCENTLRNQWALCGFKHQKRTNKTRLTRPRPITNEGKEPK